MIKINSYITELIKENKLYTEYQPLLNSSTDSIYAYEALMRSTPRISPLTLLQHARKSGVLYELDTASVTNAIREYPNSYLGQHYLFINVLPSTLVHADFEKFINHLFESYPQVINRIVFELNEDWTEELIWSQEIFLRRIEFLRSLGLRIAFDDLAITGTSIKKMDVISPDFVKLDHTRSKGLSQSHEKQKLVKYLLQYTNSEMKLVLEGIETEDDLNTAKKLGVPLLQGYHISKPKRLL